MYEERNIKSRFKRDLSLVLIILPIVGIFALIKEWETVGNVPNMLI
jgi:hypothetical protein